MVHSPAILFFRRMFRRKLVFAAFVILSVIMLMALVAPWVAPYEPTSIKIIRRLRPPGELNWLGTDEFGRDILSRIIYGARASLGIGFAVVLVSMTVGTLFGLLAGYFRSLDGLVMRVVDATMALPDILLAIFLVAVLGASAFNVVLALSIVYTPRVIRVVRASTLVLRELPFVEAARALGVSTRRILSVHILLNVASPVLVQATFIFAYAVLAEAGLSFLGAGVPPEVPTWGTMIASGQQYADSAFWVVLFPGLAIVLAALSLQVVGDGLRDMLDPKLRKTL
ncbi:ABC transporter permease [Microvirga roseola]|uniref:ABC transporter permease n=1 Tax=Microvirga roseola TaxID=2883126 RepID=UPI001E4DF861|nr:ABC transporter permease [Microvirga roseola]